MSERFDRFKEALEALCREHCVQLAASMHDDLEVWDHQRLSHEPIYGGLLVDRTRPPKDGASAPPMRCAAGEGITTMEEAATEQPKSDSAPIANPLWAAYVDMCQKAGEPVELALVDHAAPDAKRGDLIALIPEAMEQLAEERRALEQAIREDIAARVFEFQERRPGLTVQVSVEWAPYVGLEKLYRKVPKEMFAGWPNVTVKVPVPI